jgi:hypothetical protein
MVVDEALKLPQGFISLRVIDSVGGYFQADLKVDGKSFQLHARGAFMDSKTANVEFCSGFDSENLEFQR